ncbi:MAG: hypothetical protein CVV44_19090 [Spirochaetae bacterium HGW-Spirochaetae-1]|jgi:hypothetical protein|nr:MAG: hypothetical protein CVV44_19090 [Spirochaetae bacterium HGW-Spirochaetae-1]
MKKYFLIAFFIILSTSVFLFTGCFTSENDDSMSYTDITLGVQYNETIPSYGTKIYRVLTTTAGNYEISLTNLGSDLGWTLCSYDAGDNSLDDLVNNIIDYDNGDQYFDNTDEVYTEALAATTYYYIVVDEYDSVSSSYTLEVDHN